VILHRSGLCEPFAGPRQPTAEYFSFKLAEQATNFDLFALYGAPFYSFSKWWGLILPRSRFFAGLTHRFMERKLCRYYRLSQNEQFGLALFHWVFEAASTGVDVFVRFNVLSIDHQKMVLCEKPRAQVS